MHAKGEMKGVSIYRNEPEQTTEQNSIEIEDRLREKRSFENLQEPKLKSVRASDGIIRHIFTTSMCF